MKKNVSQSPSQVSPQQDFTALASVFEDMAQALRDCTQASPSLSKGRASTPEQKVRVPITAGQFFYVVMR